MNKVSKSAIVRFIISVNWEVSAGLLGLLYLPSDVQSTQAFTVRDLNQNFCQNQRFLVQNPPGKPIIITNVKKAQYFDVNVELFGLSI